MMARRRAVPRPEVLTVLELIPADDWITDEALAEKAIELGGVEVVDGCVRGLRSLRRAGAVTIRRHDGVQVYARTPLGSASLATWALHHTPPVDGDEDEVTG